MITKYKIFEKYWTEEEIKPTKLIQHLVKIFEHFGYSPSYHGTDNNVTYFEKDDDTDFYIKGGLGSKTLVYQILQQNDFTLFFPKYLSTISGLSLDFYVKGSNFLEIFLKDIDKVIDQITIDDIEMNLSVKKYNL